MLRVAWTAPRGSGNRGGARSWSRGVLFDWMGTRHTARLQLQHGLPMGKTDGIPSCLTNLSCQGLRSRHFALHQRLVFQRSMHLPAWPRKDTVYNRTCKESSAGFLHLVAWDDWEPSSNILSGSSVFVQALMLCARLRLYHSHTFPCFTIFKERGILRCQSMPDQRSPRSWFPPGAGQSLSCKCQHLAILHLHA